MEEFPEIRVKEFSIYYQSFDQTKALENFMFDLANDDNKTAKIFKILIKLIDLILRVHSLGICKMRIKANQIYIIDEEIKLYFPTDMHIYPRNFEGNEGKIKPVNGFEEDILDFAYLISYCLEIPILYKNRHKEELKTQIEEIKINCPRFEKVWKMVKKIYCQELYFTDVETIKKRLENIAHQPEIKI